MRREEDRISVRNLEGIQEDDPAGRPSRLGALLLSSLGGACIVFAAVLLMRTPSRPKAASADPLGDLVARARPVASATSDDGVGHDVTFPSMLSDAKRPTTALEAVRDPRAPASAPVPMPSAPDAQMPPAAADRLPAMPLPAQQVLETSPVEATPGDTLTAMAKHVSRDEGAETAPAGMPGGYQLQVSSFKTQPEADSFAAALRRRGHKAYVEPAQVKGRGLWYRVRIGPFKYKHSAVVYRQEFEQKERMVTFIVDPPKTQVVVKSVRDDDE